MIGNFPAVLNFNQSYFSNSTGSFVKELPVLLDHTGEPTLVALMNRLCLRNKLIEFQDFGKRTDNLKKNLGNIPQSNKLETERSQHVSGYS